METIAEESPATIESESNSVSEEKPKQEEKQGNCYW